MLTICWEGGSIKLSYNFFRPFSVTYFHVAPTLPVTVVWWIPFILFFFKASWSPEETHYCHGCSLWDGVFTFKKHCAFWFEMWQLTGEPERSFSTHMQGYNLIFWKSCVHGWLTFRILLFKKCLKLNICSSLVYYCFSGCWFWSVKNQAQYLGFWGS